MAMFVQRSQVMPTCLFFVDPLKARLASWQLGGPSMRPWVVATSSVPLVDLELGTVDSFRAGLTAAQVKEAEFFDCLRGSSGSGIHDFVPRGRG